MGFIKRLCPVQTYIIDLDIILWINIREFWLDINRMSEPARA